MNAEHLLAVDKFIKARAKEIHKFAKEYHEHVYQTAHKPDDFVYYIEGDQISFWLLTEEEYYETCIEMPVDHFAGSPLQWRSSANVQWWREETIKNKSAMEAQERMLEEQRILFENLEKQHMITLIKKYGVPSEQELNQS